MLFRKCNGYSQSIILKEECAELIVALSHFERKRKGSFNEIIEELSHVLISCFAFIICANIPVEKLLVEVNKKYNKYHTGVPMTSNEVMIKITLTDDNITLDGENLIDLSEDDIIDSIKMLVSLAETLNILQEGDATNGNA